MIICFKIIIYGELHKLQVIMGRVIHEKVSQGTLPHRSLGLIHSFEFEESKSSNSKEACQLCASFWYVLKDALI